MFLLELRLHSKLHQIALKIGNMIAAIHLLDKPHIQCQNVVKLLKFYGVWLTDLKIC